MFGNWFLSGIESNGPFGSLFLGHRYFTHCHGIIKIIACVLFFLVISIVQPSHFYSDDSKFDSQSKLIFF